MKSKRKRISKVREYLLDLFFPSKCILCRELIGPGGPRICEKCQEALFRRSELQPELRNSLDYLSGCISAASYKGELRSALLAFKFSGRTMYAEGLADLLAVAVYGCEDMQYDIVSWLPVSPDRRRQRGYDQAELIAKAAARRLCKEAVPTLQKQRRVKPQSLQKDKEARKKNVQGVYSVIDPELIRDRRILLIDDIITTGATMSEGAKTLLQAGADAVYGASVARTI